MKKVLIVIGDVAGGHMSCANAVKEALEERSHIVKIVNLMEYSFATRWYEKFYYWVSRIYFLEIVFNTFYILINKSRLLDILFRKYFELTMTKKNAIKIITEEDPDIVITNNGVTAVIIDEVKRRLNNFVYVVTVPDLMSIMRFWATKYADFIFSPTTVATELLINWDIKRHSILEGYYPLRKITVFTEAEIENNRIEICKQFGFMVEKKIILITGCGFGTQKMVKNMKNLFGFKKYQFIIITGKDQVLFFKIK